MWNLNKQEFYGRIFLTASCENGQKTGENNAFSTKWNGLNGKSGIMDWKIELRGESWVPSHKMGGKEKSVEKRKKVLTGEGGCGNISHALSETVYSIPMREWWNW